MKKKLHKIRDNIQTEIETLPNGSCRVHGVLIVRSSINVSSSLAKKLEEDTEIRRYVENDVKRVLMAQLYKDQRTKAYNAIRKLEYNGIFNVQCDPQKRNKAIDELLEMSQYTFPEE